MFILAVKVGGEDKLLVVFDEEVFGRRQKQSAELVDIHLGLDELDNIQFAVDQVFSSVMHLLQLSVSLGPTEECEPEALTNDRELESLGDEVLRLFHLATLKMGVSFLLFFFRLNFEELADEMRGKSATLTEKEEGQTSKIAKSLLQTADIAEPVQGTIDVALVLEYIRMHLKDKSAD